MNREIMPGPSSASDTPKPTRIQKFFAIVWGVLAIGLAIAAVLYLSLYAMDELQSAAVYFVAFAAMFVLLFIGEGAEVAVSMLADKDVEQFPVWLRPRFAALDLGSRLDSPPVFISGRQAIVVFAVVGLTLLCTNFTEIGHLRGTSWPVVRSLLSHDGVAFTFTLLFPALTALWFTQLPSKFLAHKNPLRTFSWEFTRWLIVGSIFLGKHLRIDVPSRWLTDRISGPPRSDLAPLGPGRRAHYETSAMLRGGRALKSAHIAFAIRADGSLSAKEVFRYHAFADGLRTFPQRIFMDAKVLPGSAVRITDSPRSSGSCAVGEPQFSTQERDNTTMQRVDWAVTLQSDLPIDGELELEVTYETAAGAMQCTIDADDYYFYNVKLVPTAEVTVEITPATTAPFIFIDGRAEVSASEDPLVESAEAARVKITPVSGGYQYKISYPLFNTEFRFRWKVGQKPPAIAVP